MAPKVVETTPAVALTRAWLSQGGGGGGGTRPRYLIVGGLGWVGSRLALKVVTPRPVCPYLTGSTGYPPLVVWSHSRPDY